MNRPIQAQIPNSKKNVGELTLPECEEYYNNELLREARELLEYQSYLNGKFEVAQKNSDLTTAQEIAKEVKYLNERISTVSDKMVAFRKLWDLLKKAYGN